MVARKSHPHKGLGIRTLTLFSKVGASFQEGEGRNGAPPLARLCWSGATIPDGIAFSGYMHMLRLFHGPFLGASFWGGAVMAQNGEWQESHWEAFAAPMHIETGRMRAALH